MCLLTLSLKSLKIRFGPRCARVAVDPGKTKSLRAASFRVSFGVVFLFGCAREARGFTAGLRGGPGGSGVFVCPLAIGLGFEVLGRRNPELD